MPYDAQIDTEQLKTPFQASETKEAASQLPSYCNLHPLLSLEWTKVRCPT